MRAYRAGHDRKGGHACARPRARLGRPRSHGKSRDRSRGQSLVEFALAFPLFLTVALAVIEFSFAFHAVLSVDYASRTAALLAAEGGSAPGSDCIILRSIEANVTAPADKAQIVEVDIYQSDKNGNMIGTATSYERTGATTCTFAGGTTITVPYSITADGYPEADRCNILAGCGTDHPSLDTVGVMITYHHAWVTPLRAFVGGNPGGFEFARSNATRMEPIL